MRVLKYRTIEVIGTATSIGIAVGGLGAAAAGAMAAAAHGVVQGAQQAASANALPPPSHPPPEVEGVASNQAQIANGQPEPLETCKRCETGARVAHIYR